MTWTPDAEWAGLERIWRGEAIAEEVRWVRRQVDRQTRLLRLLVAVEVLVSVVALGSIGLALLRVRSPAMVGLAIAAIVHTAIVWAFAIWNRTGVWRPLADSTRAYLAIARERCRREQRTARFILAMMAAEAAALAAWITRDPTMLDRAKASPWWWLPPLLVMTGFAVWAIIQDRLARARLIRLDRAARAVALDEVTG